MGRSQPPQSRAAALGASCSHHRARTFIRLPATPVPRGAQFFLSESIRKILKNTKKQQKDLKTAAEAALQELEKLDGAGAGETVAASPLPSPLAPSLERRQSVCACVCSILPGRRAAWHMWRLA